MSMPNGQAMIAESPPPSLASARTRSKTAEERIHLARLAAERPEVCWDRLLFSLKESVHKAWFPLTRRWLGFEQALVRFGPGAGAIAISELAHSPVRSNDQVISARLLERNLR